MSGGGGKKKMSSSRSSELESEVDQLLRAAEDHVLLNLQLNSHTTKSKSISSPSSSYHIDPDLDRRFEALKAPSSKQQQKPTPKQTTGSVSGPAAGAGGGEGGDVDEDDLSARFNALKTSLGHNQSPILPNMKEELDADADADDNDNDDDDDEDGGVSKKEVDKLVQWAMDAARLQPTASDSDREAESDKDDDDSEEEEKKTRVKQESSSSSGKGKPKKWYFF